jgi:hypothetical protein
VAEFVDHSIFMLPFAVDVFDHTPIDISIWNGIVLLG